MRTVSEQEIISLAPNTGAVSNGRKISSSQRFVSRMRSADDTFYMGECKGSGKSNYRVSADFVKERQSSGVAAPAGSFHASTRLLCCLR